MPRPSKLTPEIQDRICKAIRAGNYYEPACQLVGIAYFTFRRWMDRGEKQTKGAYREFCEAVHRAEAAAEAKMVRQWRGKCPEDWRAARDFLARRFPDRWAQKESLTILRQLAKQVDGMTDEELAALDGRGTEATDPAEDSGGEG
jgi:transposase